MKASLESQLYGEPCDIEDSEEMFWLRQSDDYASKVKLGNLLAGQYRFTEALEAYEDAKRIKNDDMMLYIRIGGGCLTLRRFEEAEEAYSAACRLGGEKAASYAMGIMRYMQGQYHEAQRLFEIGLPCGGEMAVALTYWHSLCAVRLAERSDILDSFDLSCDVGHHTAYKLAVSVMTGKLEINDALETMRDYNDLDFVVALYGIMVFSGDYSRIEELFARTSVWPCVSYLAALNDIKSDANSVYSSP